MRGYVINIRDVTERMQFEDQLSHQAFHDLTTGLANRALFCSRTVHALERHDPRERRSRSCSSTSTTSRRVNDSLGHVVRRPAAQRGRSAPRRPRRARRTPSRGVGGDEFAILLEASPEGDAVATASARARPARAAVPARRARGLRTREHRHRVRRRDDVAAICGAEQLLRNADIAMYIAKDHGKAQCRDLRGRDARGGATAPRSSRATSSTRSSAASSTLHYQPVVAPRDGRSERLRGAAALAAPDARHRAAARLHPARRGDRPDRADRPPRAARGVPRRRPPERGRPAPRSRSASASTSRPASSSAPS